MTFTTCLLVALVACTIWQTDVTAFTALSPPLSSSSSSSSVSLQSSSPPPSLPTTRYHTRGTTTTTTTSLNRLTSSSSTPLSYDNRAPLTGLFSTASPSSTSSQTSATTTTKSISKLKAMLSKIGMITFIVGMCLSLPFALLPPWLLWKIGLISQVQQQQLALRAGQFCARWLLRLIPFCNVQCESAHQPPNAEPSIWVCNHTSALDVFMLLAKDLKLRGPYKRPIKIVYWQGLEDNPITKLLFRQCGFIPVQMAANAAGDANDYDVSSFKNLLKKTKQAFNDGFDVGILPEGQLNPHPTEKLLPCFPGAYTLAKMSRRPIQLMALHGTHQLWHAREDIGMTVTGRNVQLKVYPGGGRKYTSPDEFIATFEAVVGSYATTGRDLPDDQLNSWLDGTMWSSMQEEKEQKEVETKEQQQQQQEAPTNVEETKTTKMTS